MYSLGRETYAVALPVYIKNWTLPMIKKPWKTLVQKISQIPMKENVHTTPNVDT